MGVERIHPQHQGGQESGKPRRPFLKERNLRQQPAVEVLPAPRVVKRSWSHCRDPGAAKKGEARG
jgi:hypothetical protein